MSQKQGKKKAWDRFKSRAQDLKVVRNPDCACPPNDWTVNTLPPPG